MNETKTGNIPVGFLPRVVPQIQVTLNCNLSCSYCFQKHKSRTVGLHSVESILRKTVELEKSVRDFPDAKIFQIYWHGGEPLLGGLDFFQTVVELEDGYENVKFDNRVQTNGTLMTEELAGFFAENNFNVGFSIDGPEEIHNRHRHFRNSRKGSFEAAMKGIEIYRQRTGVDRIPVIAVITRHNIDRVESIYSFFKSLRAKVQLDIYDLRCLDMNDSSDSRNHIFDLAPSLDETARFLIELFNLWFYDESREVDFGELRNEVKMILQPDVDRGNPFHKKRCDFRRIIFSPDGLAFSCDQYVNDAKTAVGDINKDSLEQILERKEQLWEQIKKHIRKSEKNMACGLCKWGRQCGGGCIACMKYNSQLLRARSEGIPDWKWHEAKLAPSLENIRGETYYCDALRKFRKHVKRAVEREMCDG